MRAWGWEEFPQRPRASQDCGALGEPAGDSGPIVPGTSSGDEGRSTQTLLWKRRVPRPQSFRAEMFKLPAAFLRLAAAGVENARFRKIPVSCFHRESRECRAAERAGGGVPRAGGRLHW